MADQFVIYTTTGGENWGYIANLAYGDPNEIKTITDANPDVKIDGVLKAGITLRIPVLDVPTTTVDPATQPIWKQ